MMMTVWLLNSAVLPAGEYGTYSFTAASWDNLAEAITLTLEPRANHSFPHEWSGETCDRCGIDYDKYEWRHDQTPCVGRLESRIGYPETAELIHRHTGYRPEVSRDPSVMQPGDVAYVVRLRYRVTDPARKGAGTGARDEDWEVARLERLPEEGRP